MFNGLNPMLDIDRRIEDLQNLKRNYQQPITNIINTTPNQSEFEARYIGENENVNEIFIQKKTAFISLKNGKLYIKEINGDIATYDLIIPKTPEQLKIEELERRLEEYEHRTNNENGESTGSNFANDESTAKATSSTILKKSK